MKSIRKQSLGLAILFLSLSSFPFSGSRAQIIPVLTDDFESYPGYQVCTGYTTDIQVYPTHGTNSSNGLRTFMNSFDSKDSLITGWLKPLPSAIFGFDFRIMEASALYPFIPATLNVGDRFALLYTTDGQQWSPLEEWSSSNFTPITAFTHVDIPIPPIDSARFKFLVTRTNNPNDYFVDIDNFDLSNHFVGIDQQQKIELVSVYPTVFENQLVLESSESAAYRFELSDFQGKIVLTGTSADKITRLQTTDISNGYYQLRVIGKESARTYKLVKSR